MAKKVNKSMVGVLAVFGFILMTVAGVLMVWQLRETDPQRFVDLAIVIVYLVAVVALGLWASRGIKSSKDFFLAGRSLPW